MIVSRFFRSVAAARPRSGRPTSLVVVVLAILACQVILFWPSLSGRKLLLSLDMLAQQSVYLPRTPETEKIVPHERTLADPVLAFEPARRFASREIRAGRIPLWDPYMFAGVPFTRWSQYSVYDLVYYLFDSPRSLAWIQLLKALVAGTGALLFFRRILGAASWASGVGAVCYSLSPYMLLWHWCAIAYAASFLGWLFYFVGSALRHGKNWAFPATALLACTVSVTGQTDVSALVLLAGTFYAIGLFVLGGRPNRSGWSRLIKLALAFILGLALAAPYVLPLGESVRDGSRSVSRLRGELEERPPAGISALPQVVLPNVYGTSLRNSVRIVGWHVESAAGSYIGLLTALLLAPLAWCNRSHRSTNVLFSILAVIGIGWTLNLPVLVPLGRLPYLNLPSYNRFVFLTAFALLSLAVIGLSHILQARPFRWRNWFWVPAAVTVLLVAYCLFRAARLPGYLYTELPNQVATGTAPLGISNMENVAAVRESFRRYFLTGATLSAIALVGWIALRLRGARTRPLPIVLGVLTVGELLLFAWNRAPQCDPELYYPELPIFRELSEREEGRVVGYACFPANLNELYDLRNVCGYDGIDPRRNIDVLNIGKNKRTRGPSHARVGWYVPTFRLQPAEAGDLDTKGPTSIRLHPVLDMLNLRYVVFRGAPPTGVVPLTQQDDYWLLENPLALPRAYVPERVETVSDEANCLQLMARDDFDPRRVAYAEIPINLPDSCLGSAVIVDEIPREIRIACQMVTPGLLVLSDTWHSGWKAELDGKTVPVLRVNHMLRGVVLPSGSSEVRFRYDPESYLWGLRIMGAALLGLMAWCYSLVRADRRNRVPA
ncbi:MAG: hypothetical protein FJY73_11670 [Candidatus Eisenbacteria bacterium]|nr:hypothetical protein [Candidatus Eisenbacteria bacterium]